MNPSEFLIDSNAKLEEIFHAIEARWPVLREPEPVGNVSYLDTFDWRLFREGWSLCATRSRAARELTLSTREGETRHRLTAMGAPAFARDLPPGELGEMVTAAVEPRRICELVRVTTHGEGVRILNADEKTVVRLVLQERTARRPGQGSKPKRLPAVVRVAPVKGYGREHDVLLALLVDELGLRPVPEGTYASTMEAVGLTPGGYTSRPIIDLSPRMRATEAARAIHHALLGTMLVNTDGVRRNLDPEFLHDYRVAVRRTRSALNQMKGVFPASAVRHFSDEFKWQGRATGPVRDLDVYLLKMADFRAELPEDVREDLAPLERYLQARHAKVRRRLVRTLSSDRYAKLLDRWKRFLEQPLPDDGSCRNAARPVIELADERIWHAYRRVCKQGGAIGPKTPATALHALRIECKKLRYLHELFAALYPPEEVWELIEPLKQLQKNLGDFNDGEVQQLTLRRFANEMHEEGLASADSLLAMGRLMDHLLTQQFEERQRFKSCFASFSLPGNRKRYRHLFKRFDKGTR